MKYFLQIFFLALSVSAYSQKIFKYKFDDSANITGCGNVFLQKISKDQQYELMVELKFDSILKYTDLDIRKYSQFIKVYIRKYQKGRYIREICNDVSLDTSMAIPIRYDVISGTLKITEFFTHNQMSSDSLPPSAPGQNFMVSISLKNVVLKNEVDEKIELQYEFFKRLLVGWIGG